MATLKTVHLELLRRMMDVSSEDPDGFRLPRDLNELIQQGYLSEENLKQLQQHGTLIYHPEALEDRAEATAILFEYKEGRMWLVIHKGGNVSRYKPSQEGHLPNP